MAVFVSFVQGGHIEALLQSLPAGIYADEHEFGEEKMTNESRYYFSRLNDEQKIVYEAVLSGVKQYDSEIHVMNLSGDEMSGVFNAVLFDNPMLFYVSGLDRFRSSSGEGCSIEPKYTFPKQFAIENTAAVNQYLRVFDSIKNKSDEDKEAYVHDYCLDNFTYDFAYDFSFTNYSFSVLGPVLKQKAVCEGIAKFVKLAFDYLGVKSLVVTGTAINPGTDKPVPHGWNIVRINGKTYHLDVTFDMTMMAQGNAPPKNKMKRYDYFNLSDADIKKDHVINGTVPACTIVGGDYFSVNSLVMNNSGDFENHVAKVLRQGKKNIMVKLLNVRNIEAVIGKLMEIVQRQYAKAHNSGCTMEGKCNPLQMVFEINLK